MALKENPFKGRQNREAWQLGYDAGAIDQVEYRKRIVDQKHEQFIESLRLLAQEYGGERFVYTAASQEDLEEMTRDLGTVHKAFAKKLGEIQMNY